MPFQMLSSRSQWAYVVLFFSSQLHITYSGVLSSESDPTPASAKKAETLADLGKMRPSFKRDASLVHKDELPQVSQHQNKNSVEGNHSKTGQFNTTEHHSNSTKRRLKTDRSHTKALRSRFKTIRICTANRARCSTTMPVRPQTKTSNKNKNHSGTGKHCLTLTNSTESMERNSTAMKLGNSKTSRVSKISYINFEQKAPTEHRSRSVTKDNKATRRTKKRSGRTKYRTTWSRRHSTRRKYRSKRSRRRSRRTKCRSI